jgi:hypothetical protein
MNPESANLRTDKRDDFSGEVNMCGRDARTTKAAGYVVVQPSRLHIFS